MPDGLRGSRGVHPQPSGEYVPGAATEWCPCAAGVCVIKDKLIGCALCIESYTLCSFAGVVVVHFWLLDILGLHLPNEPATP